MKKFKFLKISHTKKLRYIDNYSKEKVYFNFLPGFMSDMKEKNHKLFLNLQKRIIWFLALEYSGHGKSSGIFTEILVFGLTIQKCNKNCQKNFLLIGSSMGAWITLNQFKYFKSQIKGFIGIS